jgi:hypothetical protein
VIGVIQGGGAHDHHDGALLAQAVQRDLKAKRCGGGGSTGIRTRVWANGVPFRLRVPLNPLRQLLSQMHDAKQGAANGASNGIRSPACTLPGCQARPPDESTVLKTLASQMQPPGLIALTFRPRTRAPRTKMPTGGGEMTGARTPRYRRTRSRRCVAVNAHRARRSVACHMAVSSGGSPSATIDFRISHRGTSRKAMSRIQHAAGW